MKIRKTQFYRLIDLLGGSAIGGLTSLSENRIEVEKK